MKRKLLLAGIVALLIPFVFGMPVFTADDVTITGTVEAMAIDDNDNITAVTTLTLTETDPPLLIEIDLAYYRRDLCSPI